MGLPYSVSPYIVEDFSGGMNDRDNPAAIADNEAALIQNWHIDKKGKLYKRSGLTLYGTDLGTKKILGMATFYRGLVNADVVMAAGAKLYYYDSSGADWASLDTGFTTDLTTEFETAKDILFITNGTDNVHSWDRSSVVEDSSLTDEGDGDTDPPKCKWLKWHRNYMFFAGNSTNNNYLYVSNLNDPQTCTRASDYFVFSEPITALGELKDFLVVFGERSIWTLQVVGVTLSNWVVTPVNDAVGCVAPRSIRKVDNDLYYLANDGVRSLLLTAEDKVRVGRLSDKIKTTIDSINSSKVGDSCAAFYKNKYYLGIPTGASTYPNTVMVLDTVVGGWMKISGWTPSVFTVYNNETTEYLYMGEAQADTKTYQAEYGSTDNGTSIDADWQGKAITVGYPDRYKRWYRCDVWAYDPGDYQLSVSQNHDDGGFEALGTMDLQSGGTTLPATLPMTLTGSVQRYSAMTSITNLSRQLQIGLRNAQATSGAIVHKFALHYKLKTYGN